MNILGVSCFYHDAAAALLRDGQLVAASEEERFSRKKHDSGFPQLAIEWCLRQGGITANDLDYVVFYEKPFVKFERILMSSFQTFPRSWSVFKEAMVTWLLDKMWIKGIMREKLGVPPEKILFAEHHHSHAAATYLCSPFQEAGILTIDGVGEWTTASMGIGRGNEIQIFRELRFPHSVGLLYSAFTAYLGFEVNEGEYKVMGLAPYGKPRYVDKIWQVVKLEKDGSIWLDMDYFSYHFSPTQTFKPKLVELMGRPPQDPKMSEKHLDPFYCDVAASIQKVCEDIMCGMATAIYEATGQKKLCMAGGVALNSVGNARILRETPIEEIYVQPAAGDGGSAVGCALYAYHCLLGNPRKFVMEHAFWGAEYGDADVRSFLTTKGIRSEHVGDDVKLFDRVTDYLVSGKVIGWYQGRFEWGPRALGNRSILADARRAEMKDVVNAKIKFREAFRPFAPSILSEKTDEYFDVPKGGSAQYPTRFMLYVVPVHERKRHVIPAITHVDGTGRLQAVRKESNPRYHGLISTFEKKTGVPVVLNTSFNLKGEPIVTTPENAYNTFMRSEMDVLVLGNHIVMKDGKGPASAPPVAAKATA